MLKLIYHTAVFGPIDFEYDQPVVRVVRSEDNDLVLRHPSVEPHHCLLVFRGEQVLCLPPNQATPLQTEAQNLDGPELCAGDPLTIGELQFTLTHSSRTVALPEFDQAGSEPDAIIAPGEEAQAGYYCSNCRVFIKEAGVKRLGLVGRVKRNYCPRCSHPLE